MHVETLVSFMILRGVTWKLHIHFSMAFKDMVINLIELEICAKFLCINMNFVKQIIYF